MGRLDPLRFCEKRTYCTFKANLIKLWLKEFLNDGCLAARLTSADVAY